MYDRGKRMKVTLKSVGGIDVTEDFIFVLIRHRNQIF